MNAQHPDLVVFYIQTKKKVRKITAYRSDDCDLKLYHDKINVFLKDRFTPSIFSKAYVQGRSIYHNAVSHLYNDYFIMLDIKDFFPSICHKQLADKIFHEINLKDPNQISRKECSDIVESCSISSRGLPLGFVTSPLLSNIYLKEFDKIFYGKLRKLGLKNVIMTRYADDITISFKTESTERHLPVVEEIILLASSLLSRYGLRINKDKTRSFNLNVSNHVKVTGINITKDSNNYRRMTVGRSLKTKLYRDVISNYGKLSQDRISKIKGLQAFILSVEKTGYETCYSEAMLSHVRELGFSSLTELINSLDKPSS